MTVLIHLPTWNRAAGRFSACLMLVAGAVPASAIAAAPQPISDVVMVAAGGYHTCALTMAGGVKCWGENSSGQLGDYSTTSRSVAINVPGLASGVSAIAAGNRHTCIVTTAGGVKCWGFNSHGQLGDGSNTSRFEPVDVPGLSSGVTAIVAGDNHTCALAAGGAMKCWGSNLLGQLGDNSTTNRPTPADVAGLSSGVVALAAGADHTCALTAGGAVKCWGRNHDGQLGDGSTTVRLAPVDVPGLAGGIATVTAGSFHTCALTTGGGVKCWGGNYQGQLGDNSTAGRLAPVDVEGLGSGVTALAAGITHTCAIAAGGAAKCWGGNQSGQLGDDSTTNRQTPVDVSGPTSGLTAISAGRAHTCAIAPGGAVKCWGEAVFGQLGDDYSARRPVPSPVAGLASGAVAVAAGNHHTCALTSGGGVKCWGSNYYGQLGDDSRMDRPAPGDVPGLAGGVAAITAGESHSCALATGGGLKCWGNNGRGQLGDGSTTYRLAPVDVSGLASGIAAVAAGNSHTCALTSGGGVKCWGSNFHGQLGNDSSTDSPTPVDVPGLASGIAAIAAGANHTCALTATGGVKCWGFNAYGQLGDNSVTTRTTPVDVANLATGIAAIAAGGSHTCALTNTGGVKCWGFGAIGDGGNHPNGTLVPVDVAGLSSGVAAIAAGSDHTCAVMTGAGIKCWGYNSEGQLGDDSGMFRNSPVDAAGLATEAPTFVAGGGFHTCAVVAGGAVKCWGSNFFGQLGLGTASQRLYPGGVFAATIGLSVAKDGAGSGNVSSSPPGIDCGATCSFDFAEPVVTLTATAAAGSVFTGWSGGGCSGTGTCTVTVSDATTVIATFVVQAGTLALATNPASLGFVGQSMGTTSPAQPVTVINVGNGPVTVSGVSTTNAQFAQANDCTALAVGASCTVNVTFSPAATAGPLLGTVPVSGSLAVASDAAAGPLVVPLSGTAEKSLVSHYYRSILRREPDAAGESFWETEATRMSGLGANVNEAWYAMAAYFFTSPEYVRLGRDDTGFVTDLYNTFFNRPPDGGGLAYWTGQIAQGMPREVVLVSFMLSPEFTTFTQGIFGNTAARKEVDTVMDFYRGLLSRLPDNDGFAYWVQLFRAAQCQGAEVVDAQVQFISTSFLYGYEYAARNRTHSQFVGDLYNAILRRGGDLGGVQFWINQLDTGARTRDQVRQQFIASAEFQNRVTAIINQGCLP